jgi:hypothetical protein
LITNEKVPYILYIQNIAAAYNKGRYIMDYKKKNMSKDRENGRGNKRARRVTRGSRNPLVTAKREICVNK